MIKNSVKVKYIDLIKYIVSLGYKFISCRGSHCKYRNGNHSTIIVKRRNKEIISHGKLNKILKAINKKVEDFLLFYYKIIK